MKSFRILLIPTFFLLVSGILCAQSEKKETKNGARFNFENFQFSTQSLYKEIDQSKIKAVKLSFRELSDTVTENKFLFNPQIREADRISLTDLLFWAIKEHKLTVYDPSIDSAFFKTPITIDAIKRRYTGIWNDTVIVHDSLIKTWEVKSYRILEATIYDKNNKIITVRPQGLCPIRTFWDEASMRTIRIPLFWVYFPDIMTLLSNHVPETDIKGVKTTLDFFTKNLYRGEYLPECHINFGLFYDLMWKRKLGRIDTASPIQESFDISWIYKKVKDGMYINPYNKMYQGLGKLELNQHSDLPDEPGLNPAPVSCVKYVYKTINLRDIENYPLYFPPSPYLGQKSLIDVIYNGIEAGKYNVFRDSVGSEPMTLEEVREALGEVIRHERIISPDGREEVWSVSSGFQSSEVKKYIIKEAEFYAGKGTLIGSRIIGLVPIREYTSYYNGYQPKIFFSHTFFVPFTSIEVKKVLSQNDVYRFTSDDNISFLSFFLNKKYKVESVEIKPASVSGALKEFGIQPVETAYESPVLPDTSIIPEKQPKVIFREVYRTDSANYQLFQPGRAINGLKNFFEFIMYCLEKGKVSSYEYLSETAFRDSPYQVFETELITKTLNDSVILSYPYSGRDSLVIHTPEEPVIAKYIFKELHIDSAVYIISVCPVQEYYESNDYVKKNPGFINTFEIPFSTTFWQELSKQEISRLKCEPEKTFGEYFAKHKYHGKIVGEYGVPVPEAKEFILSLTQNKK